MSDNPGNLRYMYDRFFELPLENRVMIVDNMIPDDRFRFTICSNCSHTEARVSIFDIYSLEFCGVKDDNLRIHVLYEDYEEEDINEENKGCGFILEFIIEDGNKFLQFLDLGHDEIWSIQLRSSIDLIQFAAKNFETMLTASQNNIKKLIIRHGPMFLNHLQSYEFEVDSLDNLEVLEISCKLDASQFLSKLHQPLKILTLSDKTISEEVLRNYEFSTVQKMLLVSSIKLNYENFLKLKASKVSIHIGELTELDICNYITLWKNGQTGKKVECYDWDIEGSTFDIKKLLKLLGEKEDAFEFQVPLFIKHNLENGRKAVLFRSYRGLIFDADPKSDWSDPETTETLENGVIDEEMSDDSESKENIP